MTDALKLGNTSIQVRKTLRSPKIQNHTYCSLSLSGKTVLFGSTGNEKEELDERRNS